MTRLVRLASALALAILGSAGPGLAPAAAEPCLAEQATPQVTDDPALCAALDPVVRKPGALRLDQYEAKLEVYLRHYCHRNRAAGWRADKRVRDTGPFTMVQQGKEFAGKGFGTHNPVLVWYSPEMTAWLAANRPESGARPDKPPPIPDGAIMVKEMYPYPASACADAKQAKLLPTSGAAVMVRDTKTAFDGWFWGWFGWSGWKPDWPAAPASTYPNMGFGQYCVNCHASARDNQTFASLRNIENEPGEPLAYLSQDMVPPMRDLSHHEAIAQATADIAEKVVPGQSPTFLASLGLESLSLPRLVEVQTLPPSTYDNVWARPRGHPLDGFLTSDQCLGCHDAGSTGLQLDMTGRRSDGLLVNLSPYGLWRTSPMGMAGRDPVFLAQLASETESFHPKAQAAIEGTCFGCHGVLGQRAQQAAAPATADRCAPLARATLDVAPFPMGDDPIGALANYAGLARDGVSCGACHRMALGKEAARVHGEPQNACLEARRAFLTPGLTGLAASFTGSFDMGAPDVLSGPFKEPREMPMRHALGIKPAYDPAIASAELCASCHTVHLPILKDGAVVGHTYEQTTYAEWAFSAYRTGKTPDGDLPLGAGAQAQTCQGCHMPSRSESGHPFVSKIASIQEHRNFPATENTLPPGDIDLPPREGFARHTLVGLNLVFTAMVEQFPAVLGLPDLDPMLPRGAVPPLAATEHAILSQAAKRTATIAVEPVVTGTTLDTKVTVTNLTGHKFPSGVGFRRAFVELIVRDAGGAILWASGLTNEAGVILDGHSRPLDGELWWTPDCSARIAPQARRHQPHYQEIVRQDQVQIYEDLAAAPSADAPRACTAGVADGPLTTSFLSRCTRVKDNRLLPAGFLSPDERARIAGALGAARDLADEAGPAAVADDPDYLGGGGDTLHYRISLPDLPGPPASVEAKLYYQSTPPYFLQDRACTARGKDGQRLMFLVSNLRVAGTALESWKLAVATSGKVAMRRN